MIRTCPKCRAYYADASVAFCLDDGTPLIDLDPRGDSWSEGVRAVEEKASALRKRERRLKWRVFLLSAITTMVVTTVVCVVTINGLLYLREGKGEGVPARPVAQSILPAGPREPIIPDAETEAAPSPSPSETDNPETTPTAEETVTHIDTPTDEEVSKPKEPAGPTADTEVTATPTATPPPPPPPRTPTPTPPATPTPTPTLTTRPTPATTVTLVTPTPSCTADDRSREKEIIVRSFGRRWLRGVEGDRRKIIGKLTSERVQGVEASLVAVEYSATFFRGCAAAAVTARFVWQARVPGPATVKVVPVTRDKTFACAKLGGAWICN